MIYAQIHTYNGNQQTIAARFDQPDSTWVAYDVPSVDWLSLVNGAIVVATVDPAIARAQASQSAAMNSACQTAIQAGFSSSALGSAYTYGCKATDQANINLTAISGGSLWCENSAGAWTLTSHTPAQAQQVQKDMAAHIQAQQANYAKALTDIAAATTVAGVEAVTWAAP
ncbi:MAG: hypothetical protein KGL39_47935 [Patescibacteria group bacterium]|nr:hypothetical protein [Patescibacteria group bacterium]